MIENGFRFKKTRGRRYPAESITDSVYADDQALFANTHAQAESWLLKLEQLAEAVGFYVNANKTEFMSFKQEGATSALSCKPLKLVNQFTYLGRNISSTKSDTNICELLSTGRRSYWNLISD